MKQETHLRKVKSSQKTKTPIIPLVTFGIPAYKNGCLEEVIKSILNQTYANIELIIVNDASPENLRETVSKFHDPRLRYYENKENLGIHGPVKNWNKVLTYAQGEFFILASDDDVYMPTFASDLLTCFYQNPKIDIAHCRLKTINAEGKKEYSPSCPEWESGIDFVWHGFHSNRLLSVSEFLCRTNALRNIGGFIDFPLAWSSDYATWFSLATTGGVGYSGHILLEKRNLGNNMTSNYPLALALQSCFEFKKWFQSFAQQLNCQNELDQLLLGDIFTDAETYYANMHYSAFSTYWMNRLTVFSPMIMFVQWVRLRQQYNISVSTMIRSEVHVCSNLLRSFVAIFKR